MILTELGVTFERDGDEWFCRELPQLRALAGGGYQVTGQVGTFANLPDALSEARRLQSSPECAPTSNIQGVD